MYDRRQFLEALVLGGTGAMGPYIVRAAIQRGHRVSVFSRGQHRADLPSPVERHVGGLSGPRKADARGVAQA
jgi:2'-hydroxyisoflavone reductase